MLALVVMGVLIISLGGLWALRSIWLLLVGRRTQGVVLEMRADDSGTYAPIVSFTPEGQVTTADGQTRQVQFHANAGRSTHPGYVEGQTVPVLYHPTFAAFQVR
jgi:hypothetical protein